MTLENTINRRDVLTGAGAGLLLLMPHLDSKEVNAGTSYPHVSQFEDKTMHENLRIESDGIAMIYRNDGRYHDESAIPYVSISPNNKSVILHAPKDRFVSLTLRERGKIAGMHIDPKKRMQPLTIKAHDNSWVTINDRSDKNWVPLINAYGNCKITTPNHLNVDWTEENSELTNRDMLGKVYSSSHNPHDLRNNQAFQVAAHMHDQVYGDPNGEWNLLNNFFADSFGRVYLTGPGGRIGVVDKHGKQSIWDGYSFPNWAKIDKDGNPDSENYFPTKAFADLLKKPEFWELSYDDEYHHRNSGLARLKAVAVKNTVKDHVKNQVNKIKRHTPKRGLFGLFKN